MFDASKSKPGQRGAREGWKRRHLNKFILSDSSDRTQSTQLFVLKYGEVENGSPHRNLSFLIKFNLVAKKLSWK